jgi:hypothetical protein
MSPRIEPSLRSDEEGVVGGELDEEIDEGVTGELSMDMT